MDKPRGALALACFRRDAGLDEHLPAAFVATLRSVGDDYDLKLARRLRTLGGTEYWAIPTGDRMSVWLSRYEEGQASGGCLASLDDVSVSGGIGMRLGQGPVVFLVADGYEWVRCGHSDVPVRDNFALVEIPATEWDAEAYGPSGRRRLPNEKSRETG
jgi:hypothetical protein